MRSSQAAFDLIVKEEVSSEAVYRKKYQRPEWPGVNSGATVGIGFNLASDRATVDFSFEKGKRESGASLENFNSLFVGLTVRP